MGCGPCTQAENFRLECTSQQFVTLWRLPGLCGGGAWCRSGLRGWEDAGQVARGRMTQSMSDFRPVDPLRMPTPLAPAAAHSPRALESLELSRLSTGSKSILRVGMRRVCLRSTFHSQTVDTIIDRQTSEISCSLLISFAQLSYLGRALVHSQHMAEHAPEAAHDRYLHSEPYCDPRYPAHFLCHAWT